MIYISLNFIAGIVGFVAVEDQAAMQEYGVQGFPTIKWFGQDKKKPEDYRGGRDAKGIKNRTGEVLCLLFVLTKFIMDVLTFTVASASPLASAWSIQLIEGAKPNRSR